MEDKKYFSRQIDESLMAWKNSARHKPLLLRGARQVGKSSSVRHLAKQFDYFVEINFERKPAYLEIFKGDRDAKHIVEMIKSITGEPIVPGKTLLFFDEIQMCQEAISFFAFFLGRHAWAACDSCRFSLRVCTQRNPYFRCR